MKELIAPFTEEQVRALKVGDEVAIEVLDGAGRAVFGQIRQRVVAR